MNQEFALKKLVLLFAPLTFILSACVAPMSGTTTGTTTTTNSTAQQLGITAIKIAANAKCNTELNKLPAWQTATRLMTAQQKQSVQTNICSCVSEKAPTSVTAVDLAAAAIDPAARTIIVNNAVNRTINACINEALQ